MRVGLGLYGPLESKTPATMLAEIEDRAAASGESIRPRFPPSRPVGRQRWISTNSALMRTSELRAYGTWVSSISVLADIQAINRTRAGPKHP
jgi:hypothetical protein